MSHRFDKKADEFVAQVQNTRIEGATEFELLCHAVTESGEKVTFPMDLAPVTKVRFEGADKTGEKEFAEKAHRDTIIGNINSMVRTLPDGFMLWRDAPEQVPLKIMDVEMEVQPI